MSRKTQYDSYSDTFKAISVELGALPGVRAIDVAEVLDIHPIMLYRWKKELREGEIMGKSNEMKLESKVSLELQRLKKVEKAHKRLLLQHEILKKSTLYFSHLKRKSLATSTRREKSIPST